MSDGSEPVSGDEILYRRIPADTGWYDPDQGDKASPHAFRANRRDTDGISFHRGKYATAEEVCAKGREGKRYYVAELVASELFASNLRVDPDPLGHDPGHCVLRDIHWDNASTDEVKGLKVLLAERLTRRVIGPYPGKRSASPPPDSRT